MPFFRAYDTEYRAMIPHLSTYDRIHRLSYGAFAFTFVLFYAYIFSHLDTGAHSQDRFQSSKSNEMKRPWEWPPVALAYYCMISYTEKTPEKGRFPSRS